MASFTFAATAVEAKPRKRYQVERQKPRAVPAKTTIADDDGARWRYGSSAIMVDANTGRVLYEDNADALRHPASVTKVMTLYLLFEQLEQGRLKLTSDLDVSARAAAQSPSKLGLRPGASIEVEDAIKALVTRSANDVAVVIAEAIGGTESDFAQMMTAKARALGMSRTTFRNASGWPNPNQVTTARDLALLGRAIQDRFPRYYKYFATRTFYYRGAAIGNHNRLLGRVEGVDGIKTGYTRASGFNLLTSVKRDDRYLVGVVLGGRSGSSRDARMAELISDHLPRAYAGARTAPKLVETATHEAAPRRAEDKVVAATAPLPPRVARDTEKVVALLAQPMMPLPPEPPPARALTQNLTAGTSAAAVSAPAPLPPRPAPRVEVAAAPSAPAPAPVQADAAQLVAASLPSEPVTTASITPASVTSGAAARGARQDAAKVGSAEPIRPTGVKTVAIQRATSAPVVTASLAPPTRALGYVGPTGVVHLAPPASAQSAAGAITAATAPKAVTPVTAAIAPARRAPEPSAEELARYEASVWPVFDKTEAATAPREARPPVRTAALGAAALPARPAAAAASAPPASSPPASAPPASARTGWVIQIGAFDAETAARAKLDLARAKAKSVLGKADPYTEKVVKGSAQLYRARFAGFDEKSAKEACRLLQRNDFACMTLRN